MGARSHRRSTRASGHTPAPTLTQLMRTHCTECTAPVQWLTDDQARARGIDLAPALDFLGINRSDEIWTCTRCDNFGVIGPTEHGTL